MFEGVQKLEMKEDGAKAASSGAEAWRPNHVIFGEWPDVVANLERVSDVELLLRLLPAAKQAQYLRP